MIIEVRTYRIKAGRRDEFVEFFETMVIPALESYGIAVIGPLPDLENPNKVVWLRAFPSLEERDLMKADFYDSELWEQKLEPIAMPMIEAYDFVLCATSPGVVCANIAEEATRPTAG